ncbi:hypothetical protein ACFSQD_19550, partial [Flavihumibacter stibioxidans]|uniref:hypothetical protein n=1 Tax=Flavihumibacter stibioxidans TaxID=1834163 RepID=UPI003633D6F6
PDDITDTNRELFSTELEAFVYPGQVDQFLLLNQYVSRPANSFSRTAEYNWRTNTYRQTKATSVDQPLLPNFEYRVK